jgi:UDP-glucose 4-epimerase
MKVLVTGGAGYIGSHTCIELHNAGHELVVIDNLCNSSKDSIGRIEELVGYKIPFYQVDIRDKSELIRLFKKYEFSGVIHFAGLKAVGESVLKPFDYYNNNVMGTIILTEVMKEFDCKTIVFSSSATVYGNPHTVPIKEDFPLSAVNPYGRSKIVIEDFLNDIFCSDDEWRIAKLRYFNPIGAHSSGRIGEDPLGIPNNLMPFISQVAIGKLNELSIFGRDYDTHDGTGVRDYIHVIDLAKGHIKALESLNEKHQLLTLNLGTGKGYSVLDMVEAFERISGVSIPYKIKDRRPGDIAICLADPRLALEKINWSAEYGLDQMCRDSWNWQKNNPNGYR